VIFFVPLHSSTCDLFILCAFYNLSVVNLERKQMHKYVLVIAFAVTLSILSLFKATRPSGEQAVPVPTEQTCSGNGLVYYDAPDKCQCHECFTGVHCEKTIQNCILNNVGNPLLVCQNLCKTNTIASTILGETG
jgi:hypothetical protein